MPKIREKQKFCGKRFVERTPEIIFRAGKERLHGQPFEIWHKVFREDHNKIRQFCLECGISYYSPSEVERNLVLSEVFGS